MEYIEHGDLAHYIKEYGTLAKLYSKSIASQILEGLVVLHERAICHRDLKPQVRYPICAMTAIIKPLNPIIQHPTNLTNNCLYGLRISSLHPPRHCGSKSPILASRNVQPERT